MARSSSGLALRLNRNSNGYYVFIPASGAERMHKLKAELIATPGEDKPFKVVVTREGALVSAHPVSSEIAGRALIVDIEKMSREGRFELRPFDGPERRKHPRDDMLG